MRARFYWASSVAWNLLMAVPLRTKLGHPYRTHGIRNMDSPAVRARGRRPLWPPDWGWEHWGQTPAGPFATPLLSSASPGYGKGSPKGVVPYSFFPHPRWPMARAAEDCAIMLQAIAGYDPDDPGSANLPVPDYTADLNTGIRGMRIGVIRHFYESRLPPEDETRRAFEATLLELTKLGAVLEEVKLR